MKKRKNEMEYYNYCRHYLLHNYYEINLPSRSNVLDIILFF